MDRKDNKIGGIRKKFRLELWNWILKSQSWMLIIRFSDFIQFFNRQKTLALVVILRCVLPMWDLWFKRVN